MNKIICTDFASPDLEFIWQDVREQDPKDAAQIDVAYVGAGIMTVDEVRARLGLLPIGKQKTENIAAKKFNSNHDPDNGQFTSGDGGSTGSEKQRIVDALVSGVNNPSKLPQGVQVASAEELIPAAVVIGETIAEATTGAGEKAAAITAEEVTAGQSGNWKLGDFKSPQKWANQMLSRGWTNEEIDQTIATGEKFPAPNFVNKENVATRYVSTATGKYLIRDDATKEILQIGGKDFEPPTFP